MKYLLIVSASLLIGCVSSAAETLGDDIVKSSQERIEKQMVEQRKEIERAMQRTKPPVFSCVKKQAHELSSSAERAETVARATLGSCAKEEESFRQTVLHLGAKFGFPARDVVQDAHQRLYELALTIIVRDRLPSSGNSTTVPPPR
jgi:hypothetical protein